MSNEFSMTLHKPTKLQPNYTVRYGGVEYIVHLDYVGKKQRASVRIAGRLYRAFAPSTRVAKPGPDGDADRAANHAAAVNALFVATRPKVEALWDDAQAARDAWETAKGIQAELFEFPGARAG